MPDLTTQDSVNSINSVNSNASWRPYAISTLRSPNPARRGRGKTPPLPQGMSQSQLDVMRINFSGATLDARINELESILKNVYSSLVYQFANYISDAIFNKVLLKKESVEYYVFEGLAELKNIFHKTYFERYQEWQNSSITGKVENKDFIYHFNGCFANKLTLSLINKDEIPEEDFLQDDLNNQPQITTDHVRIILGEIRKIESELKESGINLATLYPELYSENIETIKEFLDIEDGIGKLVTFDDNAISINTSIDNKDSVLVETTPALIIQDNLQEVFKVIKKGLQLIPTIDYQPQNPYPGIKKDVLKKSFDQLVTNGAFEDKNASLNQLNFAIRTLNDRGGNDINTIEPHKNPSNQTIIDKYIEVFKAIKEADIVRTNLIEAKTEEKKAARSI